MNQFILVLILAIIVQSETVNPTTDFCTCQMIKSQSDCKTLSNCSWTKVVAATSTTEAIAGSCEIATTSLNPIISIIPTSHCPKVADPAIFCWKTLGCAYFNNVCTHFTGCTAYVKTTNLDCQAISSLCISDGTQCIDAKSCNEYSTKKFCTENTSISGITKCIWENKECRDYICTEADTSLTTDSDCNSWLQGCVTTGKGCISTLGTCSSYSGGDVNCSELKGTDGNCEQAVSGKNCNVRICENAASTLVTDADCIEYQEGCITNGKGCVSSPLPVCAAYLGDNVTCVGYRGSDGICEGDSSSTNCRSRICANAPISDNTDALCITYKTGCVTTGKGCATYKSPCSGYSGTTASCVGYIGTDGYCKGSNEITISPCAAKVCSDAPITTSTDAECVQFQLGCKSTGKGCAVFLGLCQSYSGSNSSCQGYIGSDGKCKGTLSINASCDGSIDSDGSCTGTLTDTVGPCASKQCTDAPASSTTHEACSQYQYGCLTTGFGCVAPVKCSETLKSMTCTGTNGCGWNSICVASQYCLDFSTICTCKENKAILVSGGITTTNSCLWTGTQCRNLLCTDAPITDNSDSLCNTFLAGCLTKGKGCLPPTASCTQYQGTKAICTAFTRKCNNFEGAIATTACTERVCTDDITSTMDSQCNVYKTNCRTKGIGCIDPSKHCSDYSGIQSACNEFRGNNGTIACWSLSTTVILNCIDKTCAHSTSATSNAHCDTWLNGCLFNGAGCVTKSEPCSSYYGTQSLCNAFKANYGADQCWNFSTSVPSSCIVKNCSHSGALTTDIECKTFLESCRTTGHGCISNTAACSSYTGTLTQCEAFIGNSIRCTTNVPCSDRVCADKASGVVDNEECTNYLPNCRYFDGGCVEKRVCTSYTGNSLAKCQDVYDSQIPPQKCWFVTGTACVTRTCDNPPNPKSQQNCSDHLATCIYNGSLCLPQGACDSYLAYGPDTTTKQVNCKNMINSNSKYCWNSGPALCEDRTCLNVPSPTSQQSCDYHMSDSTSCWWDGSVCQSPNICSNYNPTGTSDSIKLTICQTMKDNSNPPNKCYFTSGSTSCVSRLSSNVPTPISQQSCDNHLQGKFGWNGTVCVDFGNCHTYTPTGATDAAKKIICEALSNADITPKKCTFISGVTTCVNRTCQNAISAMSKNDCTQWVPSYQWNEKYCEPTTACFDYTPFGIHTTARTSVCRNLKDSSTNSCTQTTYAAPLACSARICSTLTSPQGVIDCTNFSSTCRWAGIGSCVEATGCTLYAVIGTGGAAQCAILTDLSGAVCGYVAGVSCSVAVCAYKINATNQADCTIQGVNCRYVGVGTCVDAVPCTYSVAALVGNLAKKTACENAFDTTGVIKCTYIPGAVLCNPRGGCPGYYATSYAVCSQVVNTSGIACNYTSATTCRESVCADKMDATCSADCTNFLIQCRYVGVGVCLTHADCDYDVATVGSDEAKRTLCENLTDSLGVHCTFVPLATACSARVGCSSYAGSSFASCSKIIDINGNLCSYSAGVICATGSCSLKNDALNAADCKKQGDGCRYTGSAICVPAGLCTTYTVYGLNNQKLIICDSLTDAGGLYCTWVSGTPGTCVARDCTNIISPTTNADCFAWKNTCTFTGTGCIIKAVCGDYTPIGFDNTTKRSYCAAILDNGSPQKQCGYLDNAAKCESRSCSNCGPLLANHQACKDWLNTCTHNGVSCLIATTCNLYTLISLSNSLTDSTQYDQCRALRDGISNGCDLILPKCEISTCSNITPTPTSYSDCTNWKKSCRFTGNICVEAIACTYILTGDYATSNKSLDQKITFCNGLEDNTDSTPKIFCTLTAPSVCTPRICTNIYPLPTSNDDCKNWLSNCSYNFAGGCIINTTACTSFIGLPSQCQSYMGTIQKCWSASSIMTLCKIRECTDNTTYTTNSDCDAFLTGCKTSGAGCVISATVCNSFIGNSSTCASFKGADGISLCQAGISVPKVCNDATCADNATFTTDAECNSIMNGCLTKGKGCIVNTEPCHKYQGIQSVCDAFVGNGKRCWNPSYVTIQTAYCVDKKCSDDNKSTTDTDCNQSLINCVTKGTGCIEKSVSCGYYQGTQSTCSQFKGNSGTKLCWNLAIASFYTSCIDKACIHNTTATSNTDCETFLPRASGASTPQCVTIGTGCVSYPRTCSQYSGTIEQCGRFTASDGPCKTVAKGSISASGTCTPRICSEALNSNNTDALCKTFHPTCVTNGYGCATSVSCLKMQEINSCAAKTGCSWVNNCRSIEANCSSLTTSSASICVNTPVSSGSKKCSWYNDTTCRAQTCEDLPATLIYHAQCQAVISTCTTTGSGCITIQDCESYVTEVICKAAKTTHIGNRCIWDIYTCRAKKCTDAPIGTTTNALCNSYLAGCKTNGVSCVAVVTCSILLTSIACQVDDNNKPCLFVNGLCYSYAKCEDIAMTTHSDCQSFSPLCTTNGYICTAITTCAQTLNYYSCVIGTDGTCGWYSGKGNKAAYCQKFGACSDAKAIDTSSCMAYGSDCITDGKKCIDKGTCSTYLTQIACESNGTDGVCQFIENNKDLSCRLRECTDATSENAIEGITTHFGCYAFTAKDKCTTNGTSCIAFQTCASYTVQAGCAEGTDGLCVFVLPDNTTSNVGTCKLMSSCNDANNDMAACRSNQLACTWVSGTTTQCNAHTCSTQAMGSICLPVPRFDLKAYTVCGPSASGCIEVAGNTLQSTTCQIYTLNTFTWDEANLLCTACFKNFTDPGQSIPNTTTDGNSLKVLVLLALLVI